MEYDRHILNSNNVMRTSWKLIYRELGKDCKNYGFQSLNINGKSITNHQIIAYAFNDHFKTFSTMISQKINANNCSTTTSDNNHNAIFFYLTMYIETQSPVLRTAVLPLG